MEEIFNPLKHPTKERPKSLMKRRPSKDFLRPGKNLLTDTVTISSEQSTTSNMLKLPPPPIPKKPTRNNDYGQYEGSNTQFKMREISAVSSPVVSANEVFVRNGVIGKGIENSYDVMRRTEDHKRYYDISTDEQFSYSMGDISNQEETELSFRDRFQRFEKSPSPIAIKHTRHTPEIDQQGNNSFTSHSISPQVDPPEYNAPYLSKEEMGQSQLATLKTMLGYSSDEQNIGEQNATSLPIPKVSPLEPISMPSLFDSKKHRTAEIVSNQEATKSANPSKTKHIKHTEESLVNNTGKLPARKSLEVQPISGKEFIEFLTENKSGVTSSPCVDVPVQRGQHSLSAQLDVSDHNLSIDSITASLRGNNPFKKDLDESIASTKNIVESPVANNDELPNANNTFEPIPLFRPLPPPGEFAPAADGSFEDEDSFLDPPTLFCDENENESIATKAKQSSKEQDNKREVDNKSQRNTSWSSLESDSEDETASQQVNAVNLDELVLKKVSNTKSEQDESNIYEEVPYNNESSTSNDKASNSGPTGDRLIDIPVDEWHCDDVCNWLDLVGVGHLKKRFENQGITGTQLMNIDMEILDKIDVSDMADREIILSEIYNMKTSGDDPELSVLDALDTASGSDRDKMYALLEALRAPGGEELVSAYQPSCAGDSKKPVKPVKPARPARLKKPDSVPIDSNVSVLQKELENLKSEDKQKQETDPQCTDDTNKIATDESAVSMDESKDSGKLKRSGRMKRSFKGALSLKRKGSNRLSKLFRQNSKTSLDGEQEAGKDQDKTQGIIRIYTSEDSYTSVSISSSMTSKEVIRCLTNPLLCLSDFNCYRLEHVVTSSTKKKPGETIKILGTDEFPLKLQMDCSPKETSKFLLKHFSDAQIEIHFPDEKTESVNFYVTSNTTCDDVIDVLVCKKILPVLKTNQEYFLAVGDQGNKVPVQGNVCILRVPGSLAKSKVFHVVSNDSFDDPLESSKVEETSPIPSKGKSDMDTEDGNASTLEKMEEKLATLVKENQELKHTVQLHEETIELQKKKLEDSHHKKQESSTNDGQTVSQTDDFREKYSTLQKENTALGDRLQSSVKENSILSKKIEKQLKHISKLDRAIVDLKEQVSNAKKNMEENHNEIGSQSFQDQINQMKLLLSERDIELSSAVVRLQDKAKEINKLKALAKNETQREDSLNRERDILADQNKNLRNQVAKLEENLIDGNISHKMQDFDKGNHEGSRRVIALLQNQVHQKDDTISRLEQKLKTNSRDLENKIEMLQNMITKKEVHMKEREFNLLQECEELRIQMNGSQQQLNEVTQLMAENKRRSADEEMKYHGRILHLEAVVAEKNDVEHMLRKQLHEAESDYISQTNAMSRSLEDKDAVNKKLESKVTKLEVNQRDNLRKFEKFMSEKDRLISKSKTENDALIKDLRDQLSASEKSRSGREQQLRELKRASITFKEKLESQLKSKDAQFNQHKFLLEKLLTFLSSRNPDLVQEFEEGFRNQSGGPESATGRSEKAENKENKPSSNEWC